MLSRLTLRQLNEHWAFWKLNGPMGIRRLDVLFADALSWIMSAKIGKHQPYEKFLLKFGVEPQVAQEAKVRHETACAQVYAKQHSPEAQQARRDARKTAKERRRRNRASQ